MLIKIIEGDLSASTGGVGAPGSPGVSTSLVDFDGAIETCIGCAWSASSTASSPVDVIDLPESNIKGGIGVVIHGMSVSSTFVGYDTLAAVSIPVVFSTPCGDVLHGLGSSTWAAGTFSRRAVTATTISEGNSENKEGEDE